MYLRCTGLEHHPLPPVLYTSDLSSTDLELVYLFFLSSPPRITIDPVSYVDTMFPEHVLPFPVLFESDIYLSSESLHTFCVVYSV